MLSSRGAKLRLECHCGRPYEARVADYERNWGRSCSKRCAAVRRAHRKPGGKLINEEIGI